MSYVYLRIKEHYRDGDTPDVLPTVYKNQGWTYRDDLSNIFKYFEIDSPTEKLIEETKTALNSSDHEFQLFTLEKNGRIKNVIASKHYLLRSS
jgi:hypothetical protein